MGSGVRVVDLSLYAPTRDTQRIFKLTGQLVHRRLSTRKQQWERALLAHSVQVVEDLVTLETEFMMTANGFVEVVLRALLREQTISD